MAKQERDHDEEKQAGLRQSREEAVKRYVRNENKVPKGTTKIVVANVFDNSYRVNYYGDNGDGVFKTFTLIDSDFIRIKIEN